MSPFFKFVQLTDPGAGYQRARERNSTHVIALLIQEASHVNQRKSENKRKKLPTTLVEKIQKARKPPRWLHLPPPSMLKG